MVRGSVFPSQRREYLIISVAILKAAKSGIRKTHLISSVALSYGQFVKYTGFLKSQGFIKEDKTLFQTTDKGRELIEEFESSPLIRSMLPA
jgi:predicted transcriptional regulator